MTAIVIIVLSGSVCGCSGRMAGDTPGVPAHAPMIYKGNGNATVGPVALANGNVTITITGAAVEHPTWGAYPWDVDYSYMIANNTTGEWLEDEAAIIADYRSVDDTGSVFTRSSVYDVRSAGDYIFTIMAKNETVRWEISIS